MVLVVLVVGCTWAYIQFGRDDAPERLTVDSAPGSSVPGSTGDGTSTSDGDLEGTWKVAAGSQAGYRVKESFGPAKTGDRGELEFLLLFEPQP